MESSIFDEMEIPDTPLFESTRIENQEGPSSIAQIESAVESSAGSEFLLRPDSMRPTLQIIKSGKNAPLFINDEKHYYVNRILYNEHDKNIRN